MLPLGLQGGGSELYPEQANEPECIIYYSLRLFITREWKKKVIKNS